LEDLAASDFRVKCMELGKGHIDLGMEDKRGLSLAAKRKQERIKILG
jgi:hypothetical protein